MAYRDGKTVFALTLTPCDLLERCRMVHHISHVGHTKSYDIRGVDSPDKRDFSSAAVRQHA